MTWTKWLAILPFLGFLGGAALFNQTMPLTLGMPLLLAWLVFCVLLTSAVMGIIYWSEAGARREGRL